MYLFPYCGIITYIAYVTRSSATAEIARVDNMTTNIEVTDLKAHM